MKFITKNETETRQTGKGLAGRLKGGEVVCLYGKLGAGKTTFVKGLAEGLRIKDEILSPTFTLMNVYPSKKLKLIHIDTYRLKDVTELINIGAEDYLGKDDMISIVEWPEKISSLLKNKKVVKIHFKHLSENEREIEII